MTVIYAAQFEDQIYTITKAANNFIVKAEWEDSEPDQYGNYYREYLYDIYQTEKRAKNALNRILAGKEITVLAA